jgi:hypothetical protein
VLLCQPRAIGRYCRVFGHGAGCGCRAAGFQACIDFRKALLEVRELVAEIIAQRRKALRKVGNAAHAKPAAPRRRLDLVKLNTNRLDADHWRLLRQNLRRKRERDRENEA